MRGIVVAVLSAWGCGSVDGGSKVDASIVDAPPDAAADAMVDGGPNCETDEFDGSVLQSHWAVIAGAMPTYSVTSSKLFITDSPIATTPSNTNESWLNDLDTDKGNQLGWAHAIGGEDFVVRAHLNWTSTDPELMITAIAVVDAQSTIAALVGVNDGSQSVNGGPYGAIRVPGAADTTVAGTRVEPGSADLRIERTNSELKLFVDNTEIAAGTVTALISHVSIVHVPYRLNAMNYGYGTAEVTSVEVCL